jgi:hypothetical protein
MPMVLDREIYNDVYIRYTGRSRIKGEDGNYYNCIKFKPLLIQGTIFSDGEEMEVYVTDDRNRIPIYIEAKNIGGNYKGLSHQLQKSQIYNDLEGRRVMVIKLLNNKFRLTVCSESIISITSRSMLLTKRHINHYYYRINTILVFCMWIMPIIW